MTTLRRIAIVCTSAMNPFLEAWVATLEASGARVAVVVDTRGTREKEVPSAIADRTLLLPAVRPGGWQRRVSDLLDGQPDVVFVWWGMHALAEPLAANEWPGVPRVLCVDTFPNASRFRAEVRDVWQANSLLRRAEGLVHASRRMRRSVGRATLGRADRLPSVVVASPFPLAAHRGAVRPVGSGPLRLCFTGRSDHLYSTDAGMSKDALGGHLEQFIARGAEVHVLEPERGLAPGLLDRGYRFYRAVEREEIMTGGFAEMVDAYDGHLVGYSTPNRTARQRVSNSLSTRFATAVCSAAPIVAPLAAEFTDELFRRAPIGFRADDPDEIMDRLRRDQVSMRAAWHEQHATWAGEARASELAELWDRVTG